jgi:ketosteroid isomerase-like protein
MCRVGQEVLVTRATFVSVVVLLLCVWPQAGFAQAPGSPPKITAVAAAAQEVERAEQELIRAITARDLSAYDRLVADDYVALTVEGKETTKPEVMASYQAGTRQYVDLEIHDVKVRVFGETAVLSARTTGFRVEGGQRVPNIVRYIRVYARRNGRWFAVMQMAAPIPQPSR